MATEAPATTNPIVSQVESIIPVVSQTALSAALTLSAFAASAAASQNFFQSSAHALVIGSAFSYASFNYSAVGLVSAATTPTRAIKAKFLNIFLTKLKINYNSVRYKYLNTLSCK